MKTFYVQLSTGLIFSYVLADQENPEENISIIRPSFKDGYLKLKGHVFFEGKHHRSVKNFEFHVSQIICTWEN